MAWRKGFVKEMSFKSGVKRLRERVSVGGD